LVRSENQKHAARAALIAGGTITAVVVAIMAPGNVTFDDMPLYIGAGAVGTAAMLGSIPLFLASDRNRWKADAGLTFEVKAAPRLAQAGPALLPQPTVGLGLRF
jgi:ABC-type enterobactin transport system permease subunit